MFDLNYYNTIRKTTKYFEDYKTYNFTRAHMHKIQSKPTNKKEFWVDRLDDIPDSDIRDYMLKEYYTKGEAALVELLQDIRTSK